jgi:hypothetical protein
LAGGCRPDLGDDARDRSVRGLDHVAGIEDGGLANLELTGLVAGKLGRHKEEIGDLGLVTALVERDFGAKKPDAPHDQQGHHHQQPDEG